MGLRASVLGLAVLGLWGVPLQAEAGSARGTFAVSAEVIKRCAIDTVAPGAPVVACPKGTPSPRIGRASPPVPLPSGVAGTAVPRVSEAGTPDGATVRVSVDF